MRTTGEQTMELKIALLQILPGKTLEENLSAGKKACIEAKEKGADVALFPEMWSDGYFLPADEEELRRLAVAKDSVFVNEFRILAKELQMAIGITLLEAHEPKPLNSVIFFDRTGKEILHYSKVHICAFSDENVLSEGEDFYTADLDFGRGTVKFGSMICFDREFPESARILMLKGAELILAPNACPMEINRLSALRTRAYENMLAVATCNYPKGQPDCNGHSTLFDGVAWVRDEEGSRDMCVFEAPEEPGVYVATLDLDKLRTHRSGDIMGDKYRHPGKYGILSDPEVKDIIGGEFVPW
ncbi:MAG: carbon-nitrogen hydrolase family protein [Saccharofermentans sp.]|nr:carbon-nitrogen hydrolase family protein [Saccharofermentans sp.]